MLDKPDLICHIAQFIAGCDDASSLRGANGSARLRAAR
jgi:hypothetical protein